MFRILTNNKLQYQNIIKININKFSEDKLKIHNYCWDEMEKEKILNKKKRWTWREHNLKPGGWSGGKFKIRLSFFNHSYSQFICLLRVITLFHIQINITAYNSSEHAISIKFKCLKLSFRWNNLETIDIIKPILIGCWFRLWSYSYVVNRL